MATFYVTKTVYLSMLVEADSVTTAVKKAQQEDLANWKWNDEDEVSAFLDEEEVL